MSMFCYSLDIYFESIIWVFCLIDIQIVLFDKLMICLSLWALLNRFTSLHTLCGLYMLYSWTFDDDISI